MTGIAELGGYPLLVDGNLAQIGVRESIADAAQRARPGRCPRSCGAPPARSASRRWRPPASVPVVNALTDEFHPCQILADLQTIKEHKGRLAGLTFAYLGDAANNMANSYMLGDASSPACTCGSAGPAGTSRPRR